MPEPALTRPLPEGIAGDAPPGWADLLRGQDSRLHPCVD